MKRTFIGILVAVAFAFSAVSVFAADCCKGMEKASCPMAGKVCPRTGSKCPVTVSKTTAKKCETAVASKKPAKVVSAICPVMGRKIQDITKASGKSVYKGKTYYFCCPACKPMFDKNPAKYAKK